MLYGDGVHDDTAALQATLDAHTCVRLPEPAVCYLISAPLVLRSGQSLALARYAHVRLAAHSDCVMLANASPGGGDHDIEVTGGIWDMNNLEQARNPIHFSGNPGLFLGHHPEWFTGVAFDFHNVTNLRVAHLTMKDPVTFAIQLNVVRYFTVEGITFDFNHGNPWPVNSDGVHCCGNCTSGVIRDLKGACYDDMVALNADEGTPGPIRDVQIDGLFADDCHSAVRLLAADHPIERVSISNVHGSFYQYCVGLTKYYEGDHGYFDAIVVRDIFAAKAPRHPVYRKDGTQVYPIIWVQEGTRVKNMAISDVYHQRGAVDVETIGIDEGALIGNLVVTNIVLPD